MNALSTVTATRLYIYLAFLTALAVYSGPGFPNSPRLAPIVQAPVGKVQGIVRTYTSGSAYRHSLAVAKGAPGAYSVYEYRGIPYALPPTGNRRWAVPEPLTSLGAGVFKAYEFGPACPQQARFNLTEGSTNEDCLSINVTVPAGTKAGDKLPVLFWIHGGAFIGGASSLYRLDKLAGEGRLVVVSINYRLGAFGFMPNPAFETVTPSGTYNGNYGLEDQRLAMQWVQQNIEAFGGDKNNVTVAGESAGAGSICVHLASPERVSGLFQKAVVQSAGCTGSLPTVAEAQAAGKASASIQNGLGCPTNANTLKCMRSKTTEEILKQQGAYSESHFEDILSFSPVTGDPAASPVLANATAPSSFKHAVKNNGLVAVPVIIGGTRDELRLYVGYFWQAAALPINSATMAAKWLPFVYPETPAGSSIPYATSIGNYHAYKAGLRSSDPKVVAETFGTILSDYNPAVGINNCLSLQTSKYLLNYANQNPQISIPVYQFEFADPAAPVCGVGIAEPCPPFKMGAVHSSELNYLFPNLSNTAAINAKDLAPASQKLADQIVAYWAQFAYTGNPNREGLSNWPQLSAANQSRSVMLFKPGSVGPYNADRQHHCSAFWAPLYGLENAPVQ